MVIHTYGICLTFGDIYQLNSNYDLNQGVDYFTPGGFTVITNFEVGTILGSNDDFYYTNQSGEYIIEVLAENGCVALLQFYDQPSPIELISSEVSNPTCGGSTGILILKFWWNRNL